MRFLVIGPTWIQRSGNDNLVGPVYNGHWRAICKEVRSDGQLTGFQTPITYLLQQLHDPSPEPLTLTNHKTQSLCSSPFAERL